MSETKNIISNLHSICAVFLKNTLPDQPTPAIFCGISKIHKLPEVIKTVMVCRNIIDENLSDQTAIDIAIEHTILPPCRPIIFGIGCLTENMSAYVDKILQPFFKKFPAIFKTPPIDCILKTKSVPHNALIVSMDVKTLYSSFPHSDGIKACKIYMIDNCLPSMEISNITKIIDFISTHNYFKFNDESYIETCGKAMRKKWPPHRQTHLC